MCDNNNATDTSNKPKPQPHPFSGLQVLKKLGDSKYPVCLVYAPHSKIHCAMKIFPYKNGTEISTAYFHEVRFHTLSHPNVIKMLSANAKQKTRSGHQETYTSYILMEYAPFGDFAEFFLGQKWPTDEILSRTFFHQLINGLEYLHANGVAHLDLKLENLLLGEDFNLKITDFDMSYKEGDFSFRGKGTANYRAPELKHRKCEDAKAADVYSAGIILFALVTGAFPYIEKGLVEGHDLFDLLMKEDPRFWEIHQEFLKKKVSFSEDFKELFKMMVKCDPNERATLEQVKKSAWYNGPIYTTEEVVTKLSQYKLINKKN